MIKEEIYAPPPPVENPNQEFCRLLEYASSHPEYIDPYDDPALEWYCYRSGYVPLRSVMERGRVAAEDAQIYLSVIAEEIDNDPDLEHITERDGYQRLQDLAQERAIELEAMSRPVQLESPLYRGTTIVSPFRPGDYLETKSFTSTSLGIEQAAIFGTETFFEIRHAGTAYGILTNLDELEFILAPGEKIRVRSVHHGVPLMPAYGYAEAAVADQYVIAEVVND